MKKPPSAAPVPSPQQRALDCLSAGNWQQAHEIVQELDDPVAWRIHALVHRIEGDLDNARYWYRKARIRPEQAEAGTIEEIQAIAAQLRDTKQNP